MEQQKWVKAPEDHKLSSFTHRKKKNCAELILRYNSNKTKVWEDVSIEEYRLLRDSTNTPHFNAVYDSIKGDIEETRNEDISLTDKKTIMNGIDSQKLEKQQKHTKHLEKPLSTGNSFLDES